MKDRVVAMNHLDPEGALSGLDLEDHQGMLIRMALDLWGAKQQPPVKGNAAIRAALIDYLRMCGMWPHAVPPEGIE